jgi:hypothetical protein
MQPREVPGAAPLRPKRTGTSQCWPTLRRRRTVGRHWLVVLRSLHTRAQLVREKCAFGALLRPGQKTYCAIVKVDNGGDGHFRAKAAVPCSTSFGGFMPDQPQTQSSNFRKHYRRWHVTNFPKGGMPNCTPGFPTPFAWTYQRSHRHATLRSPCNKTIIVPHLSLVVQIAVILKKSIDVVMKPFARLRLPSVLSFGLVVMGGF